MKKSKGAIPHKPEAWDKLLAAVQEGQTVHEACKIAGIGYVTQWQHRKTHPEFAAQFDEALEVGKASQLAAMEAEADRRGRDGVLKPVFQGGKKVGQIREYSDTLLIFRMKRLDPGYRDRVTAEISGPNGKPIEVSDARDRIARRLTELAARSGTPEGSGEPI